MVGRGRILVALFPLFGLFAACDSSGDPAGPDDTGGTQASAAALWLADHAAAISVDPSATDEHRYKTVFVEQISGQEFETYRKRRPDGWEPRALLHFGENDRVTCIMGATSADGFHWTKLPEPLVVEYSDTQIVPYYDALLGKYVMYTRWWQAGTWPRRS